MIKVLHVICYLLIIQFMISCDNGNRFVRNEGSFDKTSQCIKYTSTEDYDIKPLVGVNRKGTIDPNLLDLGVDFTVFNYGEEIRFIPSYVDNVFVTNIAPKCHYRIVEIDDIRNLVEKYSETYGKYGYLSNVLVGSYFIATNVIVSPLALKYIQDDTLRESDCLVYVRAEYTSEKKYRDFIFLGNHLTKYIINSHYDKIETRHSISCSIGAYTTYEYKDMY